MSINYSPRIIDEMLKAIGDVGEGIPFDQIGLSVEDGYAVIWFYRDGEWMIRERTNGSEVSLFDVKGHVKVSIR